jgi:hypothetical protein
MTRARRHRAHVRTSAAEDSRDESALLGAGKKRVVASDLRVKSKILQK